MSLLLIVARVTYRYVVSQKDVAYKVLVDNSPDDVRNAGQAEDEPDPLLAKFSEPEQSHLEVDRPRGELTFLTLEVVALIGEVSIFVAVLSTDAWGRYGTLPAVGRLISWAYILFLVAVRFLLSTKDLHSLPRLWNHTATLYGLQWLFTIFVFRSAIIHPLSTRALVYSVVEFSLSSLLLLIALTTRRGNKAVLIQREDGLEPPRHPTASLFSLATFSWLNGLIFKATGSL